jgi:murein DD-endopeptidase MepM/ murein hydrolase activator NlpD
MDVSRHRSPKGRRAHHGPPLSALVAAAGAGGAHRSVSLPQVVSTPARAVAAIVAGGALAAAGQQALTTALPHVSDGVHALSASLDRAVGIAPAATTSNLATDPTDIVPLPPLTALTPVAAEPPVADAASLVKAADLQKAVEQARNASVAANGAAAADGAVTPDGGVATNIAAAAAAAADEVDAATPSGGAVHILSGPVTSGFGGRWGTFHEGMDIAAPIGTPIHVPLAGVVISSGPASGFGLWVRVQHADGTITVYGHINRSFVQVGQHVAAGQVIAETGNRGQSTGPHLHIGVMVNGVYINPKPWLDARGVSY